mmetsp:Transcript_52613/g.139732  ORF Transcript_52613/g.139732 Transcript_52613/m.139732 type:complete len:131 (+) Transcript_52613:551-943(+)
MSSLLFPDAVGETMATAFTISDRMPSANFANNRTDDGLDTMTCGSTTSGATVNLSPSGTNHPVGQDYASRMHQFQILLLRLQTQLRLNFETVAQLQPRCFALVQLRLHRFLHVPGFHDFRMVLPEFHVQQ